ncbi:hypothetical protein [Streptomyces sp. NRRL F-2890]|uniref:hypothetical protein n=1 Tax=Streptomyces sp. NRRL F-2890 TaxID=1463845 RepID=UPI0004C5DEE0|nr:hypothetical protein [Streptomyces sp. NRRL F-2890]
MERELVIHRSESLLLGEYIAFLGIEHKPLRVPSGITDLHLDKPEGSEVVEMKRASRGRFVREALAQLLDYAPHTPGPAARLTALFPTLPDEQCLALLHRYGIDCAYRTSPNSFACVDAPGDVRAAMTPFWRDEWKSSEEDG